MGSRSQDVINWRRRTKQKMITAMGGCCQICGYDRCQEALEFHHIDPSVKEMGFGKARANPKAISKLLDELEKCILLCANCHREIHIGLVDLPETYARLDRSLVQSEAELKRKLAANKLAHVKNERYKRPAKIPYTDDEVREMLKEFGGNKSALARYLAVSESAIRKRLAA